MRDGKPNGKREVGTATQRYDVERRLHYKDMLRALSGQEGKFLIVGA
jgi:hypothetical protein